ncbi:hypothetical protein [Nocardia sp. NRRL S-836]|uniref:hypothetical protein n=1 Tax=Nocardia sp. NRRL S-836 TaxID=1519492 RepID=UPI0006AEAE7F|nr:hypothetical protein [Nocardia sp. NRRL S-836]KOV78367.1 hypothetical protein ADL03_40085 [Nocardia sp. NRRL S-836]
MFRLRRLYLDSIGVPENRFSDLLVDLTDVAGEPCDAIVWLRNGAGKTTMLSLLLALILPDRRDFLATRTKKRTLEDLVQSKDTAHVVAEWADPAGNLLLTGAVYEWDGRVRPRDYNGPGKDKLRRSWWCVHPDPSVEGSTLDDLPFTLRSSGRYDRERFRSHINELAALGVNAVVADQTIGEWHNALRERNFDPDLFHYFTEVNAAEGGIDGLFAEIDSPGAFVRYLLRFVGDKQRVAPVRELLADTAAEIAKRPVYQAEKEFCTTAAPKVVALGEAHQAVVNASKNRDGVSVRAAGFKRALYQAEEVAQGRRDEAARLVEDLSSRLTDLKGGVDAARRRRDEYRRIAVDFLVRSAKTRLAEAQGEVHAAGLEVRAWAAVEDHLVLEIAKARLATTKEALLDAADQVQPLVRRAEAAKALVAGALENEIAKADRSLKTMRSALDDARGDRAKAQEALDAANERLAELKSEEDSLHDHIARFQAEKQQLVTEGIITRDESIDAAEARWREEERAARQDVERLRAAQVAALEEISAGEKRLALARTGTTKARDVHQPLAEDLRRLTRRAAELADDARLRELLQIDLVDLAHGVDDVLDALAGAVAAAELQAITVREELARDERAILGLEQTDLLPPRPEVEKVLHELNRLGVTAHSGWHYLAKHVPADEHAAVIAQLPDVVDGVVVYGDPSGAAAEVTTAVEDVVVLAPATAFVNREAPRVVLGPARAQHDPDAASAELERRRGRHTADGELLARLSEQRGHDATRIARIEAFVGELPADGIDGLRERTVAAESALAQASVHEDTVSEELRTTRERADEASGLLADRREQLARIGAVLPRVAVLAAGERDVVEPAKARLAAIPDERSETAAQAGRAHQRREDAAQIIERLVTDIRELDRRRTEWTGRREGLPRPATPTDLALEAAEAVHAEAQRQLREEFPERELRRAVEDAEREVVQVGRAWNTHPEEVQRSALELVASEASADHDLRARAAARAAERLERANQAVGAARTDLDTARRKQAEAPVSKLRGTDEIEQPTDQEHAERLAAAAEAEASEGQLRLGQTEKDRDAAADAVRKAETRAGLLRDQADKLRQVAAADQPSGTMPDNDEETRAVVGHLVAELEKVQEAYVAADRARAVAVHDLRTWAGQDRFAAVAEDEHGQAVHRLREMFRGEHVIERVAALAGELAFDLETREKAIAQQLEQVATHKNNVVVRLSDLVADALALLNRASALSELPEGIGRWEHRKFLVVEARNRPNRDQVVLRVGELVDRMVRSGRIELDAVELLWRATEASVVEGFKATVLKPSPDQPIGRTPVEEMRKWSGGENLTASLVLFCVLARLRAEQRTGAKAGSAGGVVPLDNPLGKANYLPFLELQRKVARANGVQLVFWTGIGDLGAVTTFPRIAAMHKRSSTTREGRAYVQVDDNNSQVVDVVSAVRHEP